MESDTLATTQAERRRLPPADMPEPSRDDAQQATEPRGAERNGIFRSLVSDDGDIAGLVAYSIYKQNKLDWLGAFEAAKGRVPDEGELASYIIGEGTPRRLATYRHLAEATLSGKGPDAGAARGPGRASFVADRGALTATAIAAYAVVLLALLIGFWLALHYTVSTR